MAKSDSVDLRIIPHSERTPELEDKVKYWMSVTYDLPRNDKRIQRAKDPDSRDPMEIKTFRREEIRRIKNGAFGMCGKMYFFYNYVKMTDVEKGLIRPTYRVAQNEWFKEIEQAQKSKKYGLICVKRRRVGASWLEAADVLHDAILNPNLKYGMTSKSADDSVALFEKVKFIYDNLPEWLRPATTAGRSRTRMDFSYYEKDSKGSLVKKGTQSEIIVKPPTDIAWEGFALSKLVIDECFGKDTDILMYGNATKKVQDIKVGDLVLGDDLKPRTVLSTTNGVDQLYRIIPNKGEPWVCNSQHLLTLKFNGVDKYIDIKAEDFYNLPEGKQRYYQLFRRDINYPAQGVPFDPYWFGLWLGDGSSDSAEICSNDPETHEFLRTYKLPDTNVIESSIHNSDTFKMFSLKNVGYGHKYRCELPNGGIEVKTADTLGKEYGIKPEYVSKVVKGERLNGVRDRLFEKYRTVTHFQYSTTDILKELGVHNNKHIPDTYLKNSKENRLKLLAGLIDSDGHKDKRKNRYEITVASEILATGIKELCDSLGLSCSKRYKIATMRRKDGYMYTCPVYRVGINGNILTEIPCLIERKKAQHTPLKTRGRKDPDKTGFKIEKIEVGEYYGFTLKESPYFLLGDRTVVHNCGKIPNLRQLYAYAEPTLKKGFIRVGTPVIFGTAGDIGKEGAELMNMWYNSDAYDFKQFFFGGWMGVMVDEYGNDMREEVIRSIVYERKKRESLSSKEYNDFIQQYPLTVAEAFASNADVGLGNKIKISKQREWLLNNPIFSKKGDFRPDVNGKPKFIPNPNGKSIIFEEPLESFRDLYYAGADVVDSVTENTKKASAQSMFIMKKAHGIEAPKIVFEYTYRPEDPRDAYEQCYLALLYYNKCKVLIEKNRPGMINYFEEQGYKYLMATKPVTLKSLVARTSYDIGFHKDKYIQAYQEEIISEYIEDHYTLIPSLELLDEFNKYGMHNTDRVNAFGACLMLLKEDKTKAKSITEGKARVPNFSYKMKNGKLMYVKQ